MSHTVPSTESSPEPLGETAGKDKDLMLQVQGIVVRYGTKTVLDGVDMSLRKGEIVAILGGSGSGKSTLLKGILGLAEIGAGTVELLGQPIHQLEEAPRGALMRRIGVLFQNGALFGSLTVGENVALPIRERHTMPDAAVRELVRCKLAQVDMSQAEHMYPAELSGGMRKRAGLARALALDPEMLLCDEPSAGLDPVTAAAMDALLLQMRDTLGMTVLLVTHELASIAAIADGVVMVGGGKVIAHGPLAEVRACGIAEVDDFFARKAKVPDTKDKSILELFGIADQHT